MKEWKGEKRARYALGKALEEIGREVVRIV